MRAWLAVAIVALLIGGSARTARAQRLVLEKPIFGFSQAQIPVSGNSQSPGGRESASIDNQASGNAVDSRWLWFGGHSCGTLGWNEERKPIQQTLFLDENLTINFSSQIAGGLIFISGRTADDEGFIGTLKTVSDNQEIEANIQLVDSEVSIAAATEDQIIVADVNGQVTCYSEGPEELLVAVWAKTSHSTMVTAAATYSRRLVATADRGGKIVVCDVLTGDQIATFSQHRDEVTALEIEVEAGRIHLYSASRDGTVRLWYPEQNRMVRFVQLDGAITTLDRYNSESMVAGMADGKLVWLDIWQPKPILQQPSGLGCVVACTIDNQSILVSDGMKRLQVIDKPH